MHVRGRVDNFIAWIGILRTRRDILKAKPHLVVFLGVGDAGPPLMLCVCSRAVVLVASLARSVRV